MYENQEVPDEEGEKLANENGMKFEITSALKNAAGFKKFINDLIKDYIEFYHYIENQLQKQFDVLDSYNDEMQTLRQKSYQEWISSDSINEDRNGYYKALKNGGCSANEIKDKIITIKKHFMSIGMLSIEDIKKKFGEKASLLLDNLTLKRKKDNYL